MGLHEIGDIVEIHVEEESRGWGYNPCAEGQRAEVIGFSEITFGHVNNCGHRPGVYENHSWVKVRFIPDGKEHTELSSRLKFVEEGLYEKRMSAKQEWFRTHGENAWKLEREAQFIRPLPETRFYVGDLVKVRPSERVNFPGMPENVAMIGHVDYHNIGEKRCDGSPMPIYTLSDTIGAGGYIGADEERLELHERGKVWRDAHGLPVVHDTLEDAAKFEFMLGRTDEVRNPVSENYAWDQPDIIDGLRAGIIDGFAGSAGMFGSKTSLHCHRFHNTELGAAVRAHTLETFKDHPHFVRREDR